MTTITIGNIDLHQDRFDTIAKQIRTSLDESLDVKITDNLLIFLTKRTRPTLLPERRNRERKIASRVKETVSITSKPIRVVIFDCVDVAQGRVLPNFDKLSFIMKEVKRLLSAETPTIIEGLRCVWKTAKASKSKSLCEFSVRPINAVFTPTEIMEMANGILEDAESDLPTVGFMDGGQTNDATLKSIVSDLTSIMGIEADHVEDVLLHLPDVLTDEPFDAAHRMNC